MRNIETFGIVILAILVSAFSSLITSRIVATYYFKILDSYTEEILEMIMDLISWAKGSGKLK